MPGDLSKKAQEMYKQAVRKKFAETKAEFKRNLITIEADDSIFQTSRQGRMTHQY